jgi:Protein of unknown function (DUF2628)
MPVYTVHEPRPRRNQDSTDPDRFVFVRDGFYFWAFLLGPLWMLWHRLWLVLLLYVVATTGIQMALWWLGMSAVMTFTVGALISLLVGFEAASMRRWTYSRRGWKSLGLVVAPELESAEHRFFDSWVTRHAPLPAAPAASPPPASRVPPPATEVVGLFPAPEARPRS